LMPILSALFQKLNGLSGDAVSFIRKMNKYSQL